MLKKILISTALTMPFSIAAYATSSSSINGPTFSSSSVVGVLAGDTLQDLRQLCFSLEQNEQIKFFDKGLLCKGSYTLWKHKQAELDLQNFTTLDCVTSYEKCDRPTATQGVHVQVEAESNLAQCHIYEKFVVQAPQVPIFINSCEDLTLENIEGLCRSAMKDQCLDSCDTFDSQCQVGQSIGSCPMQFVGTFNSCDLYQGKQGAFGVTTSSSKPSSSYGR